LLFLIGLVGIIATGGIVGIGGDNYWSIASIEGDPSVPTPNARVLLLAVAVMIGLSDVAAFGVIFAGFVMLVQRLRGQV